MLINSNTYFDLMDLRILLHSSKWGSSSVDSDRADVGVAMTCFCTYVEGTHPI